MPSKVRILSKLVPSFIDYPDNESLGICVVMMGCTHHCPQCQNPDFQNPDYKLGTKEVSVQELVAELKETCFRNRTNKIVLSGGDCLSKYNINFTKELLTYLTEYDVCIYTGYDIEYVKENKITGFKFIKCGVFLNSQKRNSYKDDTKIIFASPNQMLYNSEYNLISKDGVYYFE